MRLEPISDNSKQILDTMRGLVEKGETKRLKENTDGWVYGGEEFNKAVTSLRLGMQQELKSQGFHVVGCSVRHFFRGALVLNYLYPAKRILMIPMNGTSTLSTGGQLPLDKYCYIDIEGKPTLAGENIDVVFVGFEVANESK